MASLLALSSSRRGRACGRDRIPLLRGRSDVAAAAGGEGFGIDPADHFAGDIRRFSRLLHEKLPLGLGSLCEVRFAKSAMNNREIVPALEMRMHGDAIDQQLASFA